MAARRFGGIQFAGPPNVGGMDIGSILKLAGYGDDKGGSLDAGDYVKWMIEQDKARREQAKEEQEGRQFTTKEERERAKSEADIVAGQTESKVKVADLQRKFDEMQQTGRGSAINALTELVNKSPAPMPGQPDSAASYRRALELLIPEVAQAKGEEAKAARGKRAGEITKQMIPIYQAGKKGPLAAQMAGLESEFQQDPELLKALPWSRYSELWPVTDATAATAQGQRAQVPTPTPTGENAAWNYLTGTQRIPQTETTPAAPPDYTNLYGPGYPSAQRDYETYGIQTPTAESVINRVNADPRFQPAENQLVKAALDWWNKGPGPEGTTPMMPVVGGPSAMPGRILPQMAQAPVQSQLPSPGSVANNYQYGTGVQVPANLTPIAAPSTGIMDLIRRLWGGGEEQRLPYTYGNPLPASQPLPEPVAQQGNILDVLR